MVIDIFNLDTFIDKPISHELCKYILYEADKEVLDSFLIDYAFWGEDHNKNLYKEWIINNLNSTDNSTCEHLFTLAYLNNIFISPLLNKINCILVSRFRSLTKLACLDYLMNNLNLIKRNKIIDLTLKGYCHTKNRLVKFQSIMILFSLEKDNNQSEEYLRTIRKYLCLEEAPTMFYRAANMSYYLKMEKRVQWAIVIMSELEKKNFSTDIKQEIEAKLKKQ